MKFKFIGALLVLVAVVSVGVFATPSFAQSDPEAAQPASAELKEGEAPMPDAAAAAPKPETEAEREAEMVEAVSGAKPVEEKGALREFNDALEGPMETILGRFNSEVGSVLMADVAFGALSDNKYQNRDEDTPVGFPFIVAVLIIGSIFFTLFFKFINFRGFKHAIDVVRGKFDNPEDKGEISHFRALTSALSATVGLGNIAGVGIAIAWGGPGAIFWMVAAAFIGMSAKFSSCTLGQLFRKENPDGSISGGPMYYLDLGLKKKGPVFGAIGKVLGIMFAFMVMGGAIGGGNMFQGNQTAATVVSAWGKPLSAAGLDNEATAFLVGIVLAVLVGLVIFGGIKRIGAVTSRIIPFMVVFYVIACLYVIFTHLSAVGPAVELIFTRAFTENALFGGAIGVLIRGVRRAAFSNEAGIGSAAIAHAAAKTDEPVREGMVAMLGPFIDTVVICSMTGLTLIISGVWADNAIPMGSPMMAAAFDKSLEFGGYRWGDEVLSIAVFFFAYSTMISWCYYGERGWIYLLDHVGEGKGVRTVGIFRAFFVFFVFAGSVLSLGPVLDFSDLMILCMAFPNIVGSIILAPVVARKLNDYWRRYKSGEMKPYEPTDTSAVALTNQ